MNSTAKVAAAAVGLLLLPFLFLMVVVAFIGSQGARAAGADWCSGGPGEGNHSTEQLANAQVIIDTAAEAGVDEEAIIIALATALVESDLINVHGGDRDSQGLFQQRPSQGWGTVEQITDPRIATRSFLGLSDHPTPPGLVDKDWKNLPPGKAAQDVQRSAHPERYAQRMGEATALYSRLLGGDDPCLTGTFPTVGSGNLVAVPTHSGGSITVDAAIADALADLLAAAAADGIILDGYGWRSAQRTAELRIKNGCPDVYDSPASACRVPTALPGQSMHEQGLAIDFTYQGATIKNRGNAAYKWLDANAARYGLQELRGGREPWHWSPSGG